ARPAADGRGDARLQHHIRDSAWLKERLRVLATDNGLKR
ncbi:jg12678, partial [Pararge aegeria aegeria]